MDTALVKKKYLQFTVYMEALNNVLGLDKWANVEDFAMRIIDLMYANNVELPEKPE